MESRGWREFSRAVVALLAIVAAAVLVTGCGGGEGSASGDTAAAHDASPRKAPLSKAALIAKADAICVWSQGALRRAGIKYYKGTRFKNPTERLPWVPYSEVVLSIARKTVRELKGLVPPAQSRSAFAAYVAAEEEVQSLAEQALEAAVEDNDAPYYKARKTRDAGALERNDLALAVGLKKCSPEPHSG